jgi:hypothetical protein
MGGIKVLRQIQICQETTQGTPATPTTLWRGEGLLKPGENKVYPAEDTGSLFSKGRFYEPKSECEIDLSDTPATFEQIGYLLNSVLEKVAGVADSTGSGYVYTYSVLHSAQPDEAGTLTVVAGDNQWADQADFAHVTELKLSGAGGEAVMMSATLLAHGETDDDFETNLTVPVVEEILFSKGTLYLDATGGTIGATPKATTWLGFELTIPGWKAVYTGDGALGFSFLKHVGYGEKNQITGTLTLENDAAGEAERGFARAGTHRLLRMKWTGSALTTTGVYTTKTLIVDAVIQYDQTPALDDEDGNDTLSLPFHVVEGSTSDLSDVDGIKIVLVTQAAALV